MDNLVNETNARIQEIIDNLETIKTEYEKKLETNTQTIDVELAKVKKYKEEFFTTKAKIEKMNADIDGFEEDYKNLVDRFKDDELANILIAANKEISAKIDERKRKIVKDKASMNELVEKAEDVKKKLVKLTAEKKALELCLANILDSYEFYSKSLGQIISYSEDNRDNLAKCFHEVKEVTVEEEVEEYPETSLEIDDETFSTEEIIDEDDFGFTDEEETVEIEKEEITSSDDVEDNSEFSTPSDNEEITNDETLEVDLEADDIESVDLDEIDDNDIELVHEEDIEENEEEINDDIEEEIIEGEEHDVIIDEMPSEGYDFNASLDLENVINFDDSLEDDDELYESDEKKED